MPTLTSEERRAKKAEKRIKQREITILRAGKMHKARLLAAEHCLRHKPFRRKV